MAMTIQNIPFFCLIWIGIGFLFIMAGILRMASHNENDYYISQKDLGDEQIPVNQMQELFSFFLEEEEKKNEDLRKMMLEQKSPRPPSIEHNKQRKKNSSSVGIVNEQSDYKEIVELYQAGHSVEEIAKKLKRGVGEVNLMISLYTMR